MASEQKKKRKKKPKKAKIDWLLVFEGLKTLAMLIVEILRRL